jgi:hypothetical protein
MNVIGFSNGADVIFDSAEGRQDAKQTPKKGFATFHN